MENEINHIQLFNEIFSPQRNGSNYNPWDLLEKEIKDGKVSQSNCHFFLEQLIEINASLPAIQLVFENSGEQAKKDKNLFKWACCYASLKVIKYLEDKVEIDDVASIDAALNTRRVEVLKYLNDKNYNVFKEQYLNKAFRSCIANYGDNIDLLNFYLININKVDDLSSFFLDELNSYEKKNKLAKNEMIYFNNLKNAVEIMIHKNRLESVLSKEKSQERKIKI